MALSDVNLVIFETFMDVLTFSGHSILLNDWWLEQSNFANWTIFQLYIVTTQKIRGSNE